MRHYLLTRSAYGPRVPLSINRRRLDLTRGITVRSIAAQTSHEATWLVLVDPRDPFLEERLEVFGSAGLPLVTRPAERLVRDHKFDRPWGPWSKHIVRDGATLTTRLDDDDAFAPWVLERYRAEADATEVVRRKIVWTMPHGWRVNGGRANLREDDRNQFSSLYAPPGHRTTIMDMNHTSVDRLGRIVRLDTDPAWLWLRHPEARSSESAATMSDIDAMGPITDELRSTFDIDWSLV